MSFTNGKTDLNKSNLGPGSYNVALSDFDCPYGNENHQSRPVTNQSGRNSFVRFNSLNHNISNSLID
jgi:hypothetical protein